MSPANRNGPATFSVLRLNDWSDASWAVIEPSGAIAAIDGKLLIRLTRDEARETARALSDAAGNPPRGEGSG